jgi:hypothetical protein
MYGMTRHKRSKKQLFKLLTQYGIHIWAILIIANAVLVYTYHFSTHAAGKDDTKLQAIISGTPAPSTDISPSISPSSAEVSPSTGPVGPAINLSFTVPGIGSGGGVLKPIHQKRNVTVYLYAANVNSMNQTVNPLYTVQGTATFDSDPASPTYTSFLNPVFDLGSAVQDGNYQIAFRTDLSFTTLIKASPTDIGGEIFSVTRGYQALPIPPQTVLMGDSIPNGNNYSFTINDYNAFINCYGDKNTTSYFCKGKNYADFNDDGIVDGVDYNILLRSLGGLLQEGGTLAKITPTPTILQPISRLTTPAKRPTPTKNRKVTATPNTSQKTASASGKTNSGAGGILFILFLIILVIVGVVVYLKNEKIRTLINALIHRSPTGTPGPTETTETTVETATPEEPSIETTTPTIESVTETQPVAAPATPAADGTIEKDCYVKTKGPDDARTGVWLLLTDDNGALNAHYSKNDVKDGFAKIKGIMKTEKGKTFLEITELSAEG